MTAFCEQCEEKVRAREVQQARGLVGAGLRQIHHANESNEKKLGQGLDAPKLR